jgi:hypothetical protein
VSRRWSWARLLQQGFALALARWPWCLEGAAPHRRPHARRGDPANPPASETFCSPTSHCTNPCPPGSLRVVLHLTAPGVEWPHLRRSAVEGPCSRRLAFALRVPPPALSVGRHDHPASASPQCTPLLPVCRTPCLGSVLPARGAPPRVPERLKQAPHAFAPVSHALARSGRATPPPSAALRAAGMTAELLALARLGVVPGSTGWSTELARAVGGKGRLIFLYS